MRLKFHFTKKNSAENKKSRAELLFFILSAMFWYAGHICSINTDWVLIFLLNLILENWKLRKTTSEFWQSEPENTYNTYILPFLGGFPCLQAYNLLTCDQPEPKNRFLQIKKDVISTHFDATVPLNHLPRLINAGPILLLSLQQLFYETSHCSYICGLSYLYYSGQQSLSADACWQ